MRKSGLTGDEAYVLSKRGKVTEDLGPLKKEVSLLKEDIVDLNDKKITKFYASNQCETHITDSDNGKIVDMMIYGKSSQDGTPSPENPVEIKSVVNPAIKARGKNLFNKNAFVSFDNVYINEDTTVVYGDNNRGFVIKLNKGTYYYTQRIVHTDVQVAVFKNRPELGSVAEKVTRNNINVEIVLNDTSYLFVKYSHSVSDNDIPPQSILDSILLIYKGDNTSYEPCKEQSIQLPYTLNAIPVSEGGNVTINGQQYIADYVDIEKGKLYRKVKRLNLKDADDIGIAHGFHSNGNGYLSFSVVDDVNREQQPISNRYKGSKWTSESGYVYIPNNNSIVFVDARFTDKQTAIKLIQDTYVIYALSSQTEEDLSLEQIKSLKSLSTYYPVTNITVDSEELDGYAVFNYSVSMANGWNYVKQQLNDNRDYIYDMDLQSAEAYVNSEYAVALTELEV